LRAVRPCRPVRHRAQVRPMTLLDDLQNLDLSAVTTARAGITVSISGPEVTAIIDGGSVTSALGEFGAALAAAAEHLDDPQSLLAPLVEALTDLVRGITPDDLPVTDYAAAVDEGIKVLIGLLDGVDTDPMFIGRLLGRSL